MPKFTFAWTADEVVVRYGPIHESQRAEGQARVDRLIEKATGIYRRAHVPNNDPFHHFGFRCAATIDDVKKLVTP